MQFNELMKRVNNGEVTPVSHINGFPVDVYISKNWNHFQSLTLENDIEKADCIWIYSKEARERGEYNP